MNAFLEKLDGAVRKNASRLCVGLDPDPARIPGGVAGVAAFNRGIIEATGGVACCYKPNMGFYEALGADGWDALRATLAAVPAGIPVLLDAKRGDIATTAEGYAKAVFEVLGVDAVTVSPYLGGDSLEPFFAYRDRGVFVLCHTTNDGARDLQELQVSGASGEPEPLYLALAGMVARWNVYGNAGLVAGATYPRELARVRERCPHLPVLVPGVGAQAGALEESVRAADNGTTTGFLINASRSVIYAAKDGEDPFGAAHASAEALRVAINDALSTATAERSGI